jgi:transcriptional regulator with XRE-family HTH domain
MDTASVDPQTRRQLANRPPDPIAHRIRSRRQASGWSLGELARRAGLRAASFIHHIERGDKVPSEEVATRLALALGDDEGLYRAWARARRGGDLAATREAVRSIEVRLAVEGAWPEPAPPALIRIPLLPEGADPGAGTMPSGGPYEVLRLDPGALPQEPLHRPFAYRLTAAGVHRVAPRLGAGDLVILTRNAWPIHPHAIYGVRVLGRLELSCLRQQDGTLALLSAAGGVTGTLAGGATPPAALVGRIAAVIGPPRP